jgi:hypothetical protein
MSRRLLIPLAMTVVRNPLADVKANLTIRTTIVEGESIS